MPNKNKKNKSQNQLGELTTDPRKAIYVIGVLSVCIINLVILGEFKTPTITKPISQGVVKGSQAVDQNKLDQTNYEQGLKGIMEKYLYHRNEILDQNNFRQLLDLDSQTSEQILLMSVPKEDRKVHLEIITVLDQEIAALKIDQTEQLKITEGRLADIFQTYHWLN